MKKRTAALIFALIAVLCLTACGIGGSSPDDDSVTTLVRGTLNEIYLGRYDKDFLELVNITEDEAGEAYENGIDVEARYFCTYFRIIDEDYGETYEDTVTDETKQKIRDLYKKIYSKTKFTVGDVAKYDNDKYSVPVTVSPINIFELVDDVLSSGEENPLTTFQIETADIDVNSMTDEEYNEYVQNYAQAWIDLVESQIDKIGYDEDHTVDISVVRNESNGFFYISEDDLRTFDAYVIIYP